MNGKVMAGIGVAALLVYLVIRPSPTVSPVQERVATPTLLSDPASPSDSAPEPRAPVRKTFAGHMCSGDCSGHEAGYSWAEEHDIDDEEDCEAAGEHSNSPSFAEGCKAYVNGDSDDSDGDKDGEDAEPDGARTLSPLLSHDLSHSSSEVTEVRAADLQIVSSIYFADAIA